MEFKIPPYGLCMKGSGKYIVAILVVVALVWGMSEMLFLDLFGLGRSNTRKKFPEVAQKMGLTADSEWSARVFPNFQGRYQDHHVTIEHELARIRVDLASIPDLVLNSYGSRAVFNTGNATIDGFIKERDVPPCLKDQMAGNSELISTLEMFIKKWRRKMRRLDIESLQIECVMKFGNGHYIPADVAEPLTLDIISIAELLEKACPNAGATP